VTVTTVTRTQPLDRDKIDARPVRPTSTDTLWDRAVVVRDELAVQIRATLDEEQLGALVFVSANGNYPPWVKLEAWLPESDRRSVDSASRERAELLLVVDVKPYHRHQLVVSAQATRSGRTIRIEQHSAFSRSDVAEWTRYAVARAGKPGNYHPFGNALAAIIAALPLVPYRGRNPVNDAYRNRFFLTRVGSLTAGSIMLFPLALLAIDPVPALTVSLILLGTSGLVVAWSIKRRRAQAIFVVEQPIPPPRNTGLVDSWHVVVAEFGRDYDTVKQRLMRSVTAEQGPGVSCQAEVYGYRTSNGYEERERLVVSKGQSIVHVHIYRFTDDLFVGWNAYLNWAQWSETPAVSRKVERGQTVEFRELRRGYYVPNQFDLIDLTSLSELVHRRLERELKSILKEKEIDQEIDFRIIRGDRDVALDQSRHEEQDNSRHSWRYLSSQPS
jgi:hypothetical protein